MREGERERSQSIIPKEWKVTAIRLISKGSACQIPFDLGNFQSIALTSLLRNRWLQYMLTNRYIGHSVQKAFMSMVPIQVSLQHYSASPQFLSILQVLYSSFSATIISDD